jgi:DNA-binding transcriptional LysR family regulator
LEKRGVPQTPLELLQHDCIGVRFTPTGEDWPWELERGKKTWRVPVRGPVITNDPILRKSLALAGVGLLYGLEPTFTKELERGELQIVLEAYAAEVPGLFLYFPSRAQVTPALKAFIEVAREVGGAQIDA